MADTITTLTTLQTQFADNTTKAITEQRLRNFLVSVLGARPYRAITTTATLTENDDIIAADATSGAITVNLPACASTRVGKTFTIVKTDSSGNNVVLDGSGAEALNGSGTQTISSQYGKISIVNTGTEWIIYA